MQKPLKMRHMLASHGEIGRLYLAPEDSAARKKRKKAGGNTGKNFTEGWVEFEDKSVAKYVRNPLYSNYGNLINAPVSLSSSR